MELVACKKWAKNGDDDRGSAASFLEGKGGEFFSRTMDILLVHPSSDVGQVLLDGDESRTYGCIDLLLVVGLCGVVSRRLVSQTTGAGIS